MQVGTSVSWIFIERTNIYAGHVDVNNQGLAWKSLELSNVSTDCDTGS
jgi:hypothetical protein